MQSEGWRSRLQRFSRIDPWNRGSGNHDGLQHLTNLRVYGDVELHKEECVNHVAKRLGTALRKLAASSKKSGVTLGGRGFGRLTGNTMGKLEEYYYLAVRGNTGKLNKMYAAVWASFNNASSTDKKPQHDRCPVGADSWCFSSAILCILLICLISLNTFGQSIF